MYDKFMVYNTYDKPIPYKELLLYPVLMNDYIMFHYFASVLMLDKNSVPDIKVISMSYLDYLFYAHKEETPYVMLLDGLLKICLNDRDLKIRYGYDKNDKAIFEINGTTYDGSDFDAIKEIVCSQNLLDLPDENIQKEVRDKLQEAQEYRQKINNNKIGSLEDQMICVMIQTPLKLEEIYKLTIRKFVKILQRVDHTLHYKIYLSASLSGFASFKDESILRHWMADLNKDRYSDEMVDLEKMQQKIDFSDKK